MKEEVFGIDLGTTNSCIAIIDKNDLPLVIKNLEDEITTPSVVAFDDDGNPYVGKYAKKNLAESPERTVAFIKREMSNSNYQRKIDGKEVNPIQISAYIIKKLVDEANEIRKDRGESTIRKAVITVPAYFGEAERENTKQAGQIAGLEVLGLLNEPTAAALAYGAKLSENKTILIYDLGGGTFDVSIIRINNGKMDVIATEGNHHLGGVDWDELLAEHGLLKEGVDLSFDDIREEREAGDLLLNAEDCKKRLTTSEETTFRFRYKRKMRNVRIQRSTFEELTYEKLRSTITLVERALRTAGNPQIEEMILIGGSSYMPMVKKALLDKYPNANVRLDRSEPDLAVAKGAAIYASQLIGRKTGNIELDKDKGSRSYGMFSHSEEFGGDCICNLIYKKDDMIFHKDFSGIFSTLNDGQKAVKIEFYENQSNDYHVPLHKGKLLKNGLISWGFPVNKSTNIDLIVDRDKDGIVKVWARCQGKEISFSISPESLYSEKEVVKMSEELLGKRM